eukprot:14681307-Heterocapsa_arctica.AAC.1
MAEKELGYAQTKKSVRMGPGPLPSMSLDRILTEHWRLDEDIETWKTIAFTKGWHGVWNPAIQTQRLEDGNPCRSGGGAVLVWKGRTIMKSSMDADHRLVGAVIGWGRGKSIHIMS